MKEKEENLKKQHEIDKLGEDHVKFEREKKLFEAQRKNFESTIEEKVKQITEL